MKSKLDGSYRDIERGRAPSLAAVTFDSAFLKYGQLKVDRHNRQAKALARAYCRNAYYSDSVAFRSQPVRACRANVDVSLYQFFAPGGVLSRPIPHTSFAAGSCRWRKRWNRRSKKSVT